MAVAAGDRHGGGLLLAAVADGPVGCAWRLLYEKAGGGVVPEDGPADGPAVAGAHGAAILEVDAAVGDVAAIDQQAGGPALVGFDAAVTCEAAVQDDDGALLAGLRGEEEDIVAVAGDAVEEDLGAVGGELEIFGGAGDGEALLDVDFEDSDAFGVERNADGVGGVLQDDVANPGVHGGGHGDAVELGVFAIVDAAGGGCDAEVFDGGFGELAGDLDAAYRWWNAVEELGVDVVG